MHQERATALLCRVDGDHGKVPGHNLSDVQPAANMDGQALPSVFIDQDKHARAATARHEPSLWLLLQSSLCPFAASDPLHAVLAHALAGVAQQDCDVTILIGQRDDSRVSASSSFAALLHRTAAHAPQPYPTAPA